MINGKEYAHEKVVALGGVERLDRDVRLRRDDLNSSSTSQQDTPNRSELTTRTGRTPRTEPNRLNLGLLPAVRAPEPILSQHLGSHVHSNITTFKSQQSPPSQYQIAETSPPDMATESLSQK